MGDVDLNMDFSRQVIVEAGKLDWVSSPSAGVERIRLERENAESGRATTIVRFAPGSAFAPHSHPAGEEYIVLEGTFADEKGDFGPGWYVRNPPGSRHTPASPEGCTIFVKLCQMAPEGEPQVNIDTNRQAWQPGMAAGHEVMPLHRGAGETVTLERLAPGTVLAAGPRQGGEEILVLGGTLDFEGRRLGPRSWVRTPAGATTTLASAEGCKLWIKRGHLGAPDR